MRCTFRDWCVRTCASADLEFRRSLAIIVSMAFDLEITLRVCIMNNSYHPIIITNNKFGFTVEVC